jgi:hypothetical protein
MIDEIIALEKIYKALCVDENKTLVELCEIAQEIKRNADRYENALKMIFEMTDIGGGGDRINNKDQAIVQLSAFKIINNLSAKALHRRKEEKP